MSTFDYWSNEIVFLKSRKNSQITSESFLTYTKDVIKELQVISSKNLGVIFTNCRLCSKQRSMFLKKP